MLNYDNFISDYYWWYEYILIIKILKQCQNLKHKSLEPIILYEYIRDPQQRVKKPKTMTACIHLFYILIF